MIKIYNLEDNLKNEDESYVKMTSNTSLAAPGALANSLRRRTTRKVNLDFPNLKTEITSL